MSQDWKPGDYSRGMWREMSKLFRRHVYLWPVGLFAVAGPALAAYVSYKKIQGPDVTMTIRGKNPEKYQEFEHKQVRIFELTPFDYANYEHPRPRF